MESIRLSCIIILAVLNQGTSCSKDTHIVHEVDITEGQGYLIYLHESLLENVKELIEKNDPYFTSAYNELVTDANLELTKMANPVTLKTQIPPSGDMHDYLSLAPYWWPNPSTPDGFPWIVKDGQVNPLTRGDDTDQVRLSTMFKGLEILTMAYFFSEDIKYANKALSVIRIWFIDKATRVNPNINFGQGVPGSVTGRPAGIIEWTGISSLITAMQIFLADGVIQNIEKDMVNTWVTTYYEWLTTSQYGMADDNGTQNHANWYDYQVVGIARYLGLDAEARTRVEAAKTKRIARQIQPDGSQPEELRRTKSVYYSEMNLRAMTFVAKMGLPLGVDLWKYSTSDGRSLRKAFEFLKPYALGDKIWTYQQITSGGAEKAIEDRLKPLFSIAGTIYGEELIDQRAEVSKKLSYMQKLQYPPLSMLN